MSGDFSGRRILVTGGASGIGLATVLRFIEGGALIACLDRDVAPALAFKEADLFAVEADVTNTAAVEQAVAKAAEALGGIDGLVNAAGVDLVAGLEETSDEDWRHLMAVNLDGPMRVCRTVLPHMRQARGGTIVNVSSGAGLRPLRNRTAYSASKAGLQMFSKALAMEVADHGIRVNTICPGAVETPLLRMSIDDNDEKSQRETVAQRYALRRIAEPDEIAAAIAWLSSAESSYVTGVALAIDGGRTFH